MTAAVRLDRVTHAFAHRRVVEDVTLAIAPGEFVAIVGPSGCGKSTLLRLMAGLIAPQQGMLETDSRTHKRAPQRGFVFQDPTLLPWRTALENVALPGELDAKTTSDRGAIRAALALVGLAPEDETKFPRQLSGGMRMRVSLARAIIAQPELLLLDEPFAALDDLLRQQLNEELLKWWRAQGWTAVFVTHNVAEAVFLAQRVLVMSPRPGRIVADLSIPREAARTADWRSHPDFTALVSEISGRLRTGVAA